MTHVDYRFGRSMAAQHVREAEARSRRAQLRAAAGTDHPARRRMAGTLVGWAAKLWPQPVEFVAVARMGQHY